MHVFGALLRIYSYLYHLILALFLLGIALVAMMSRSSSLNLAMLPWKGRELMYWLLCTSLFGLISILLAWIGKARILFLLYSVVVFGMMLRGYFLSGYSFSGKDEFKIAAALTVGALVAIAGAWSQFRTKRFKRRSARA